MHRYVRFTLSVGSVVIVSLATFQAVSGSSSERSPGATSSHQSTGYELARELDLSRVHSAVEATACQGPVVEVEENVAYCLTGGADSDLEEWKVAMRLRGHVPTQAEIDAWTAMQAVVQAAEAGASPAEVRELMDTYDRARAACTACEE